MTVLIVEDGAAFDAYLADNELTDKFNAVTGGGCYVGDRLYVISSFDGLESIQNLSYVTVTSYEDIRGHKEKDKDTPYKTEVGTYPGYWKTVKTGEYEDGDPIYKVNRVVTETTRTVMDEEGNTSEVPGRQIVSYEVTTEIEGYQQVPVTEQVWVEPEPYKIKVPVYKDLPAKAASRSKFNAVYDRTPISTENGTYTPPAIPLILGGEDTSLISED